MTISSYESVIWIPYRCCFLITVAAAAYVQIFTDCALSLATLGTVTVFALTSIEFTAAVVSLLTLFNAAIAACGILRKLNGLS